jgi:NitT/TauT family transport system substrate-binding protein
MRELVLSKTRFMVLAAVVAVATLAAFTAVALAGKHDLGPPSHLTIAYQPGLGSTPLILMKQLKLIEHRYPATAVDWKVLASGVAVTTGVIAGQIDIGAVGVTPMLIGWARGVNWRVLAGINLADFWLMAKDPSIMTIADLRGKRIATPANTSTPAVTLRKIAQVKLGDPHALDNDLVAIEQPDGMQALLTGQIDAQFAGPPFEFQEKVAGAHVLARSFQYFGAHSGLLAVAQQKFYDDHAGFAQWFYEQIQAMHTLIRQNPDRVAHILQDDAGGSPTWRQFKQWLIDTASTWTTRPLGLMRFANFMIRTQQLTKMPNSWRDLVFPTAQGEKGS